MPIEDFLTSYDDSLTGELNIDPLGQLVIWSSWGQDIFHSRITSIANDVRQYTLNLIHHSVMRQLMDDDKQQTAGLMKSRYPKKHMREFKAACLIHLENIYIYSMLEAEKLGVMLTGVQGINKARLRWDVSAHNPQLIFGHGVDSQLLTNQMALGTNGRYKSPMVSMKFFTADYCYNLPGNRHIWQEAKAFIDNVPQLKKLHAKSLSYLQSLMHASHDRDLTPLFTVIPKGLKKAYVQAFRDPQMVGDYSREFWLARTGLNKNAAGALYRVMEKHRTDSAEMPVSTIFTLAMQEAEKMSDIDNNELMVLKHIRQAEPFLSLIDLMFTGLRRQSSQTLTEFSQFWREHSLSEQDLPKMAAQLQADSQLADSLSGTPKKRFQHLLRLASASTLKEQVHGLLEYHNELMAMRGQFSWLAMEGECILLQVPPATIDVSRHKRGWVNNYYLPQFRHMLKGLWGNTA